MFSHLPSISENFMSVESVKSTNMVSISSYFMELARQPHVVIENKFELAVPMLSGSLVTTV
jgi:hypothetical protein